MPWRIRVLKYERTAGNCFNELCFMRIEDKVWNVFYNLQLGIMENFAIGKLGVV
jgi:hypothetical protein